MLKDDRNLRDNVYMDEITTIYRKGDNGFEG